MGLSVSASFAILAVAFFIGAGPLIEAVFYSSGTLMGAAEKVADRKMSWARTHITLDNATFNGTETIVNLTNTGSTILDVKGVSVLVNGTYIGHDDITSTVGGKVTDIWGALEKLTLELNVTANANDRVLVVTGNGVEQYGVVA